MEQKNISRRPGYFPPWRLAPASCSITSGQVDLWRFRLDVPESVLSGLTSLLSADEYQRFARQLDPTNADRLMVARARMRQILGSYLLQPPAEIVFSYGEQGKPHLCDPERIKIAFNLAHSGVWGVLAVSADMAVGVDVEKIDPQLEPLPLARQFLPASQVEILRQTPAGRRRRAFFRAWTATEARLKMTGEGLTSLCEPSALRHNETLRRFTVARGYLGAMAAAGQIGEIRRWEFAKEYS